MRLRLLVVGFALLVVPVVGGSVAGADMPPPDGIEIGPPQTTTTTAAPVSGHVPVPDTEEKKPGFFDIKGHITAAINDWLRDVARSILEPAFDLLGRTVLATPQVGATEQVRHLWGTSLLTADALLVLLVLAGGAVVMAHETLQTRYTLKEVAPRLVVGAVAAHASIALVGQAVTFANALSRAVLGDGVTAAVDDLTALSVARLLTGGFFGIGLSLVAAVFAVGVLATYLIRITFTVLLVVSAPLALVCHTLPQTEGLAHLWWRSLAACLGSQIGQSLVLATALRVLVTTDGKGVLGFIGSGLLDFLLIVCLLWVMVKVPVWTWKAAFGPRRGLVMSTARYYVIGRGVRAALGGLF